jgi:hypothetical protein
MEATAGNKDKAAELQALLQKQKDQGFSRP